MNFYYIFIILFIFTYFLNFFLIKNNLLLDSKKISIHKKFVQDRDKVSYVGGLVILVSCTFFWNENKINKQYPAVKVLSPSIKFDPLITIKIQKVVNNKFIIFLSSKKSKKISL